MAWLLANWQTALLVVLAVDAALIPLFPNVGLLVAVKNIASALKGVLSGLSQKP